MTNKTKSTSINVISALIILISLFIGVVGQTNSWFTAEHKNGVQIIVNVGDLKLNLYQKLKGQTGLTPVYTYETNQDPETEEKSYVTLNGKIIPDEQNNLELILKNEDAGSAAMYLRFKLELFARGLEEDVMVPIHLIGVDEKFEYKEIVENDENSGYYYYKESTDEKSKNGLFKQNTSGISLMTDFVVNFADIIDENGNMLNIASETLYIKLTVDASITDWLNETAW